MHVCICIYSMNNYTYICMYKMTYLHQLFCAVCVQYKPHTKQQANGVVAVHAAMAF